MKTLSYLAGIALLAALNSTSAMGVDGMASNAFRAVATGHGTWVAVDGQGRLLASSNRLDWNCQTSGTLFSFYGIAFGNGRFVAVGNEGALLTSLDGIGWT